MPGLIAGVSFGRSMRWNQTGISFSRPIRWLICLLSDRVIPFEYAGLTSARGSRGPRPAGSPPVDIEAAGDYFSTLIGQGIITDFDERQIAIQEQIQSLAAEVGGVVPDDAALLDEVTNLVEQPTALRGEFDPAYLSLPAPVLITLESRYPSPLLYRRSQRWHPAFGRGTAGQ
jgi:glycyl-tRNA synthetase